MLYAFVRLPSIQHDALLALTLVGRLRGRDAIVMLEKHVRHKSEGLGNAGAFEAALKGSRRQGSASKKSHQPSCLSHLLAESRVFIFPRCSLMGGKIVGRVSANSRSRSRVSRSSVRLVSLTALARDAVPRVLRQPSRRRSESSILLSCGAVRAHVSTMAWLTSDGMGARPALSNKSICADDHVSPPSGRHACCSSKPTKKTIYKTSQSPRVVSSFCLPRRKTPASMFAINRGAVRTKLVRLQHGSEPAKAPAFRRHYNPPRSGVDYVNSTVLVGGPNSSLNIGARPRGGA